VNVPERAFSWRLFLWLCLTFHRLSSSPVPRSRAVLPALSLPLSFTLCPSVSVSLCTQVSTSLALGQKPSVINGQPENRIRGHRARAQVNQRGGGGAEVKGGLMICVGEISDGPMGRRPLRPASPSLLASAV
jgi:hypothetical protein